MFQNAGKKCHFVKTAVHSCILYDFDDNDADSKNIGWMTAELFTCYKIQAVLSFPKLLKMTLASFSYE